MEVTRRARLIEIFSNLARDAREQLAWPIAACVGVPAEKIIAGQLTLAQSATLERQILSHATLAEVGF